MQPSPSSPNGGVLLWCDDSKPESSLRVHQLCVCVCVCVCVCARTSSSHVQVWVKHHQMQSCPSAAAPPSLTTATTPCSLVTGPGGGVWAAFSDGLVLRGVLVSSIFSVHV